MELKLEQIGKKIHDHWLFKDISINLSENQSLSITGKNGSGKSTLIQVVYGLVQATEGTVSFNGDVNFKPHQTMAITAPYIDLPLEFTMKEIHTLYVELGKISSDFDVFFEFANYSKRDANKPLKYFSSGMLQRFKTALCFSSNAPILLLDEPLTNMDDLGEKWYKNCLELIKGKICIVAGNQGVEVDWTDFNLKITE